MDIDTQSTMRRTYKRRTADQRVAELDQKIAELKAKQAARDKRDDPILREIQKLHRRLKKFIQMALDHNRPDVANSALGFKSSLQRILSTELGETTKADAGDEG